MKYRTYTITPVLGKRIGKGKVRIYNRRDFYICVKENVTLAKSAIDNALISMKGSQ